MRWRTCTVVLMLGLCPALMSAGCRRDGGDATGSEQVTAPAPEPFAAPGRVTEPAVVRARPFRAPDR